MNSTRTGKIARLPRTIRLELNHRLADGEPQKKLVTWLNSLPEVQAILAEHFEAKPIRPQNLSEWKQGGYQDWLFQQEAREIAEHLEEDSAEWKSTKRPPLTDTLSLWLATRLAATTRQIGAAKEEDATKLLREFTRHLIALRRSDHQSARLRMDQARLAEEHRRARQKTEEQLEEFLQRHRDDIVNGYRTNTEKIAAMRAAFFADIDNYELELPE